jgi:hypothetical protein
MTTRRRIEIASTLAFSAAMAAWVFGDLDRYDGYGMETEYGVPAVLSVAVAAYAVGRWWALLLPVIPIAFGILAGDHPGGDSPTGVYVGMWMVAFGLPLATAALGARLLVDRVRRRRLARA